MKYLQTKHEKNSAKITTIIVAILILLCFALGQNYQDPPEEYGVAINFGDANVVNDNVKPSTSEKVQETKPEPAETEPEEVIEEEVIEEEALEEETAEIEKLEEELAAAEELAASEEAAKVAEAEKAVEAEKLLAQQEEEALRIKNEKEAKIRTQKAEADKATKAKAIADAKAKATAQKAKADKVAKAKAAADTKAAAQNAAADKLAKDKAAAAAAAKKKSEGSKTVRFDLIENPPIYPGCESGDNSAKKKCMNDKIKQFLGENFNKGLAADLGLTGIQKVNIFFKINESGNIVSIRAKAPDPKLEEEAKRVTKLLPKMKPGMQQGRPVTVSFRLPLNVRAD
ncbi:energy transducer TonB [Lacinutrix jangbogonensis]|uniref:energy transducer TonB n=1 Tax=Lacinutrix jangbogonensis TaxID=1469557 RepID=UPI00069055B1|nr:energy transducer TonB [Lacinutrix jangbogonensis]